MNRRAQCNFIYPTFGGVQWRRGNAVASQSGTPGSIPDPVCFSVVKVSRFSYCTLRLANPTSLGVRKSHVCPSMYNPHPGNLPVRFPIDYPDVKQQSEKGISLFSNSILPPPSHELIWRIKCE